MSTSIRLNNAVHEMLKMLARQEGKSMMAVLETALENYRKQKFFEDLDTAFKNAGKSSVKMNEINEEYVSLEGTLSDGIDNVGEEWSGGTVLGGGKDND